MKIEAVLFDLDGTLIDTIPDLTYGLNRMLQTLDRPPLTVQEVSTMVGQGVVDLIERVFKARNLPVNDKAIRDAIECYCKIMVESGSSHSEVFSGVFESLTRLRAAGIRLAIVTNKPRSMTDAIVKEKALAKYVDCVVAAGDAATVKPAPEMLWFACEKLGISSDRAVMVGDSSNDAIAAERAQMPVYLVTTGYNGTESIADWSKKNAIGRLFKSIEAVTEDILSQRAN